MAAVNKYKEIIDRLLGSSEPDVRYQIKRRVLQEDPGSASMLVLQEEILPCYLWDKIHKTDKRQLAG